MAQFGDNKRLLLRKLHTLHNQHDWDFEIRQCVHIIVVISERPHHTHIRTHLHSLTRKTFNFFLIRVWYLLWPTMEK